MTHEPLWGRSISNQVHRSCWPAATLILPWPMIFLPTARSCETKWQGKRQQSEREIHQTWNQTRSLRSSGCVCYPHFKRSTNHDLNYHIHVRFTKFICSCLSKILDVFTNEIVKREKRNAYAYMKEDILLILINLPVKKAFTFRSKKLQN